MQTIIFDLTHRLMTKQLLVFNNSRILPGASGKKNLERPPQSPRKLPPFGPFPPSGISNALRWDVDIFWNYTIIIFKIKEFLPTGQFLMGRSFSS